MLAAQQRLFGAQIDLAKVRNGYLLGRLELVAAVGELREGDPSESDAHLVHRGARWQRVRLRHGAVAPPGRRGRVGKRSILPERAKVAVLISGSGTNMAALLYASRLYDCPYEIVLVASNNPDAGGLKLAEAEGVATFALPLIGHIQNENADAIFEFRAKI